jgi:uncharacterized membrane protein YbhN (UPF0104 family)
MLGGVGSILTVWLLRTARWQGLLRNLGLRVSFGQLYFWNALSLGLAVVTPMQSGELLKLRLLRQEARVDLTRGLATFATERIADMGVLALLALVAVPLRRSVSDLTVILAIFGSVMVAALLLRALARSRWLPALLRPFATALQDCADTLPRMATLLALTVGCWCVTAVGWQACLGSIGVELDFIAAVALVCVVTIVNVLSFIPGGLGISEVSTAVFLLQLGIPDTQAQAGAVIIRVYGLILVALSLLHLGLGQIPWLRLPQAADDRT